MPSIDLPPAKLLSQQLTHIIETVELPLTVIARLVQIQNACPNARAAEKARHRHNTTLVLAWPAKKIHLYLCANGEVCLAVRPEFLYTKPPECWEQLRKLLDRCPT